MSSERITVPTLAMSLVGVPTNMTCPTIWLIVIFAIVVVRHASSAEAVTLGDGVGAPGEVEVGACGDDTHVVGWFAQAVASTMVATAAATSFQERSDVLMCLRTVTNPMTVRHRAPMVP